MDNFNSTVEKHAEALSEQYQPLLDVLAPRKALRDEISEFLTEHKETMPDAAYKELMEAAASLKPVRLFNVTFVNPSREPAPTATRRSSCDSTRRCALKYWS